MGHLGVTRGTPNGLFIMEHFIKMDALRVPLFQEPPFAYCGGSNLQECCYVAAPGSTSHRRSPRRQQLFPTVLREESIGRDLTVGQNDQDLKTMTYPT